MLPRTAVHLRRRLVVPAGGCGSARRIRTGFFKDDPDYLDPEDPLLAQRLGSKWRYMDDPTLTAPILERSNVGMGMLVLNRSNGLDLSMINTAYTRLRDLEVNSLKRFVGLTAVDPGPFCTGLDPRELLLAAVQGNRHKGLLPQFSRAMLWHQQELAHLVADYRKPLVCQLSGVARNSGAALACLSNFSGAYEDSEVVVDACFSGLVPDGGMTYKLAQLKWHLGEFLALTGWPVKGADLVYSELVHCWLSPDALPFLELTAEKQLEVSETDARRLLDEHCLMLPEDEGFRECDSLPSSIIPLVDEAFSKQSVPDIKGCLEKMRVDRVTARAGFAEDCLGRMSKASPQALNMTLAIIRKAKRLNTLEAPDAFIQVLGLELRAQQQLLCRRDAILGLHAKCLGLQPEPEMWSKPENVLDTDDGSTKYKRAPALDARDDLAPSPDFAVCPRSEFPLSQHPRLRRYHPDFDPATGLDHDPEWMAAEVRRWSPDLFREQREQAIEELLEGKDPAMYGLSRWVRVEGHR